MLKIHQLFFLNILGLFVAALSIASLISFFTLKSMIIEDGKKQLIQSIELLEPQIVRTTDFDALAEQTAAKTGFRVTVVDDDGTVIADSNADKKTMENHAGRIEIMHAMSEPYGITIRYSDTVKTDFIYIAKKITVSERALYFRLAMGLEGVMEHFYTLWMKFFASFLGLTIIALAIAYNISQKARHDISQITHYLDEVSAKNYKALLKPEYFREFLQISILLKNLVKKLHNRDKQKRKHTAKLRLINKQQNDILSAISHEFKNPIAAIMGYTETLQDDPGLDPKIRAKFLEKILSNTQRVTLMLDRLALSVKLENNDLQVKPTTFDMQEVCTETVSILQGKYPHRKILYEGVPMTVHADRTMIELVLTNLVDNALKYSEEDVRVTLSEHTVTVTDKGIGIAPAELDKITSKFYRVQKNRWDNSMGLGLSIVSYILKLHGTALIIESTLGVGSTFGFSIEPLLQTPQKAKK